MVDQTADQRETQLREIESADPWVGKVVRQSQKRRFAEDKKAFFAEHPDAPADGKEYNYDLMFEQGKMPTPDGEGFGFLPTEGYVSFWDRQISKPVSRYSTKTKDNQFDDWEMRTVSQGVRGAYQTTIGRMQAEIGARTKGLIDLSAKEEFPEYQLRSYEDLIQDELETNWKPFSGKITDPDITVPAALETLAAEAMKFVGPMVAGTAAFGSSNAIKMAQGKGAFKRLMARFEDATSANIIAGEFLYAANPESMQTLVKDTGEWLRDDFGMTGPVVDALIAADDTPETKAIAGAIEGMVMFEGLRLIALGGRKVASPVLRSAKEFIAKSMKEVDAVRSGKANSEKVD